MTYLRSLFLNFLVVFFVNRVIPGIDVGTFEDVPNIGADLLFSIIIGVLNASIFPALSIFVHTATLLKIVIISFIISFGGYAIIAMIPNFGVSVESFGGYFFASLIVTLCAIFTNFLEMKHTYKN